MCAIGALRAIAVLGLLTGALAACEGVTTGTEVARTQLQAAEGGSYAPVKVALATEMTSVAINFRADFSQNPSECGKWNTYSVALSKDGNVVASRNIDINHPQSQSQADANAPPPASTVYTLFIIDIQGGGEYELTLSALQPPAITLSSPTVDVRRNVQRPPQ